MALEFICSDMIMKGKRISVPEGSNCYRLKSGKINFFYANPTIEGKTKEISNDFNEISFDYYFPHGDRHIDYGEPCFY